MLASLGLFAGGSAIALAVHLLVPRMLRAMLVSGKVYPLYGFHYFVAQMLSVFGQSRMFPNPVW